MLHSPTYTHVWKFFQKNEKWKIKLRNVTCLYLLCAAREAGVLFSLSITVYVAQQSTTYAIVLCIGYLPSPRLAVVFPLLICISTRHIYLACSVTCFGQLAYQLGFLWYMLWSSKIANHFFVQGQHNTCSTAQMYMVFVIFPLKALLKLSQNNPPPHY